MPLLLTEVFPYIRRVHYTTIQKAIARLPEYFLEETSRSLAELLSSGDMDCVVDATNFSIREYEARMVGMREQRTRETVKLALLWEASKHVCHAISCISGEVHESRTLPRLVDSVRTWIRKLFADRGFSSRDNVQHLAYLGIEPVIRSHENATPRPQGKPAWLGQSISGGSRDSGTRGGGMRRDMARDSQKSKR